MEGNYWGGIADIMPARSLLISILCAVEIHADAEHIVLVKWRIDADGCIPLELSRILKPRVIHRDRTVEILPPCITKGVRCGHLLLW